MKAFDCSAKCPKCGGDNIQANYTTHWDKANDAKEEIMQRMCRRCGYDWEERPLDHPEEHQ